MDDIKHSPPFAGCDAICFCQLPCSKVGSGEITDFAAGAEVFERAERFMDRCLVIPTVDEIDIDIVSVQAFQARFTT